MNKKLTKIAGLSLGIAMAIGVGVALSRGEREVEGVMAENEIVYTLDGSITATGNAYATATNLTQNGIGWAVVGNTEQNPWRIGGKSITNVDRAIYSKTKIDDDIAEIKVTSGATASSLSVNSLTISVHSSASDAADGSNAIATKTVTTGIASSTVSFEKTDSTSWAEKFYRIVYNVTRTSGSGNGYITFVSATFAKAGESKVLENITLDTTGVKTIYETGDSLDTTNLVVTAHYDNGDTKDVTDKVTITPPDMTTAGENKEVTVSYSEGGLDVDAKYTITVNASKTLKSVVISGQATAVKDGTWNLDNLVVTGTASDDSDMGDITDKCELTSSNSTGTIGAQHITVHVNYKSGEFEADVEDVEAYVEDRPLTSELVPGTNGFEDAEETRAITWGSSGSKVTLQAYLSGVSYSVTASDGNSGKYYSDWRLYQTGSAKLTISVEDTYEITKANFTYDVGNSGTWLDENNAVVASGSDYEYGLGNSLEFHVGNSGSATNGQVKLKGINVEYKVATPKALESLAIETQPKKTAYNAGEEFDPTGMKVVANYEGGASKEVTDYDWEPKVIAADTTKVVVSYTDNGVTKTADVPVTVKVITNVLSIVSAPASIYRGQQIDLEQVTLEAEYNDGEKVNVTPTSVEVDNMTVAAEATVTYTFDGATGTKSITGTLEVKAARRYVKTTEVRPHEPMVIYSPGNGGVIMNRNSRGNYALDFYSVNSYGEVLEGNKVIFDDSYTRSVKFYLEPVTTGTHIGQFLIYADGQLGSKAYLSRDTNDMLGLTNKIIEQICYWTVEFDPETGAALISPVNAPTQTLRFNNQNTSNPYGFRCYATNTGSPVYIYSLDSYDPYVSITPTSFTGVQHQYCDVYVNYQGQERPTPTFDEGEFIANVELRPEFSTNTTAVYRVTLDGEGDGIIDFGGQKFAFTTVYDEVESIAIEHEPNKKTYGIGETLDLDGLIVKATYKSGMVETVDNDLLSINGFNSGSRATNQKVTITFATYNASFYVNIVPAVVGIEVDASAAKRTYYVGDELDKTGLVVKEVYDDSGEKTVTENYTVEGFDSSTAVAEQVLTVKYGPNEAFTDTYTIEVVAVEADHLRVVAPTKTEYVVGQTLDTTGMEVYLVMNNGEERELNASEYTLSGFDSSTELVEGEVVVKWNENNAIVGGFNYSVIAKVVTHLNVSVAPTKTEYVVGQQFDPTGLVIYAFYNDGTDRKLNDGEYETILPDMTTPGENKVVRFTFGGQEIQILIKVVPVAVDHLELVALPTKTDYWQGEELKLDGLQVKAVMNNGTEQDVTTQVQASGYNMDTLGYQTVTLTYEGQTVTFQILVKEIVVTSIAVTTQPEKLTYYTGEELDLTGMVVTATYSDGHTAEITNFTNDPVNMDEVGIATVTIRVGDKITTFDIEIIARPAPAKRGCGGSIAATSALLSLVAVGGVALISLKKRKEK